MEITLSLIAFLALIASWMVLPGTASEDQATAPAPAPIPSKA